MYPAPPVRQRDASANAPGHPRVAVCLRGKRAAHLRASTKSSGRSRALSFVLGAAGDALLGDPPTRVHPVGLISLAAHGLHRAAPRGSGARRAYGTTSALLLPLAFGGGAAALFRRAQRSNPLLGIASEAVVLGVVSSARTLALRAREVQDALERGELAAARELLATHLVSRDTRDLAPDEVAGAVIESVAENLADGVIGPWLAFACGGVGGAVSYRVVNTLDAMWGYRNTEFEAFGWGAARADDVLNLAPARATAAGIVLASASVPGCSAHEAWHVWRRDRALTASPNAGHPMAAMSGALGVRLAKRGQYTLGAELRPPTAADVGRARRVAARAAIACAGVIAAALWLTERR
ncbi:MAG: cobalamin biosynthesis protein CobD [Chloroflexi bacterium]|nr:cobalamin biosynthesis protein CobD [Chloroflexota bacterium]